MPMNVLVIQKPKQVSAANKKFTKFCANQQCSKLLT